LRSGGSYFSQNDLRLHFGLDQAKKVDMVEIRWLSGQVDQIKNLDVNQLHVIQEGGKETLPRSSNSLHLVKDHAHSPSSRAPRCIHWKSSSKARRGQPAPPASQKLLGIGNEAVACRLQRSPNDAVEMVSSRVRRLYFTVSLKIQGAANPGIPPSKQRDIVERAAEQVAGNLF
jgi:hypothetical protein